MRPRTSSKLKRGISFIISEDWSGEQALVVVELLDDLREAIWSRYQLQLRAEIREQYMPETSSCSISGNEIEPF